METFTGLALAWAGPTAAPTVTELIAKAAVTAIRVRLNFDDISSSPFLAVRLVHRAVPIPNQDPCQSRKTAKNIATRHRLGDFANQELVPNPKPRLGTFAMSGASNPNTYVKEAVDDREAVWGVGR